MTERIFKVKKTKKEIVKMLISLLFIIWTIGNLSMIILNVSYVVGSALYKVTPNEDIYVGYTYDDDLNITGIEANISLNVQSHWLSPSIKEVGLEISLYNDTDYEFFQATISVNDIERNSNVDLEIYGSVSLEDLDPDFLNQTLLNSANIRIVFNLSARIGLLYQLIINADIEMPNTFLGE